MAGLSIVVLIATVVYWATKAHNSTGDLRGIHLQRDNLKIG